MALLVVAQLAAFWRLCESQVTKGQARDGVLRSQRVAIRDCLQTLPGASFGGCAREVAAAVGVEHDSGLLPPMPRSAMAAGARMASVPAVPVSFVLR